MKAMHSLRVISGVKMDTLKNILRQALAHKALRIQLQDGQPPEMTLAGGSTPIPGEQASDAAGIHSLYGFLFPGETAALAAGQTIKGALNVQNVGKIQLIAQAASPARLRLYLPPQGQELFLSDWNRLNSPTITPGAPGAPLAATVASPGGIPAQPTIDSNVSESTPAPPAPAPPAPAPPTASQGGFIPVDLASAPPPAGELTPQQSIAPGQPPIPLAADVAPSEPAPSPVAPNGGIPLAPTAAPDLEQVGSPHWHLI